MNKYKRDALEEPFEAAHGFDQGCAVSGCDAAGEYRAPRSRSDLRDYIWLCLDHVRAFNKSWNYYAGMSEDEVERCIRSDTTWQRQTWPLGGRGFMGDMGDQFGLFEDWRDDPRREAPIGEPPGGERARALTILDLDQADGLDRIKSRYKELVKRLHPDANGGDKEAEERLKLVNYAYGVLKSHAMT